MKNSRIRQLIAEMAILDDELRTALHEQESTVFFNSMESGSNLNGRSSKRTAI